MSDGQRWVRIPAALSRHGEPMTLGPTDPVTATAIVSDLPPGSGAEVLCAPGEQAGTEEEGTGQ